MPVLGVKQVSTIGTMGACSIVIHLLTSTSYHCYLTFTLACIPQ